MKSIDNYSFMCGVINCFNEMVYADLKQMALSHPSSDIEVLREFLPYSNEACKSYGTKLYLEEDMLTTDLFPKSMTEGMKVIIYYKHDEVLQKYLSLKEKKNKLVENNEYISDARYQIAYEFGKLLSYPDSGITDHLNENTERE